MPNFLVTGINRKCFSTELILNCLTNYELKLSKQLFLSCVSSANLASACTCWAFQRWLVNRIRGELAIIRS